MDLLRPKIQPYAWGSRTAIAQLQGRPASKSPEAELWMGAHPSAPSGLDRDGAATTLDAVIAKDPERELGSAVASRFGGRLPFLLKVLAADKALSIQVHPSREQAEAGYRADPEHQNYVDDWPKPELLYALTEFEALAGFRGQADLKAFLDALGIERLKPLATRDPRDALATVLEQPDLVPEVKAKLADLTDGPYAPAAVALTKVAADHPGDIGLVAALLLNYRVLQPGEALFMPAGGLHAYLRGTGVELLANSDNVLRAGLTGKRIDVPELLKLTDPAAEVPVLTGRPIDAATTVYDTPVPEFAFYVANLTGAEIGLPGEGPRVVLCLEGTVSLRAHGETAKAGNGESVFVSASDGAVTAAGPAKVVVASAGKQSAGK
jgi:mannose-6-phosphate isomerase